MPTAGGLSEQERDRPHRQLQSAPRQREGEPHTCAGCRPRSSITLRRSPHCTLARSLARSQKTLKEVDQAKSVYEHYDGKVARLRSSSSSYDRMSRNEQKFEASRSAYLSLRA